MSISEVLRQDCLLSLNLARAGSPRQTGGVFTVRSTSALSQDMLGKAHFLGTPGSSPAPEATLERGAPRGMHQNCCGDVLGSEASQ